MEHDPIGKNSVHPMIMDLVLANIHRMSARREDWANVRADDVTVAQQRTFDGLVDRIAGVGASHTISLSNALLSVTHPHGRDIVVCEFSKRSDVSEWRWEGCAAKPFSTQAANPYIPLSMVNERGLSLGFVMLNGGFGSVRIVFADGSEMEDTVTNEYVLFYVPYQSDAIGAEPADAWMYDKTGREILSGKVRVRPYPDADEWNALRGQSSSIR